MNNKNTMGRLEFCAEHFIWCGIAFLWYRVIFRCVGEYSLAISRIVLFGSITIVSLFFGLIEFRRVRNGLSVFLNLVIGYGIYTILAYVQFKKVLVEITLLIAISISAFCSVYIMTRRIRNRKNYKKIIVRRIRKSMLATRTVLGLSMSAIILVIAFNEVFGNGILHSKTVSFIYSDIEDQTLVNNIETVALLEETRWNELSAQEKIDVLQVVANIEQRYLGLPHELNVGATNLNEGTMGSYNDAAHQISIDLDHLVDDNPESVLNTLLHEAFHAYEHRCWDAYVTASDKDRALKMFREVAIYGEEFTDYIDGDDDSYGYYMQSCEEDARDYAKTTAEDYYEKINAFYGYEVIGFKNGEWDGYQMLCSVVYEPDGYAYLKNQDGDTIAGPYLYIEEDFEWVWDMACRYTGMNGLIGYLDAEGHEITEPRFIVASEMQDGKAMVSESDGMVYYINTDGERITGNFFDGFPYEHQGNYARVLREDGWAIINREGEVVFSGADSINELPLDTVLGSAIREGHAVLFDLHIATDEKIQIYKELYQFKDISSVYYGSFATVISEDDRYGVVNSDGDLIIEPQYRTIDFEIIDDGDNSWSGDHVRFKLQNSDGTYAVREIKL